MTSKDEEDQLLKVFKAFDTDNDGEISKEELINGYEKSMSRSAAEAKVDKIFETVD